MRCRTALADERKPAGWANQIFWQPVATPDRNLATALSVARLVRVNQRTSRKRRCLVGQTLVFLGTADERFRNGRNCGMLQRDDQALKRNLQHFIHVFDKMYRKAGKNFLRDVRQVLLIVLRKEHCTQAHSMGGEKF